MKEILDQIVHDIRSPAISINVGASCIKEILPQLIAVYKEAQKHNLNIPILNEKILNSVEKIVNNIEISSIEIDAYLTKLTKIGENGE